MTTWLVFNYLQLCSRVAIGIYAKRVSSNRKTQIALHHKPFIIPTH